MHWLPIKQRIIFKVAILTFKTLNGLAPNYLENSISRKINRRNLRSNNQLLLEVPEIKNSFGSRSFTYSSPHIWNDLPYSVRSSSTLQSFKNNLKHYLFGQAFE